MSPKQLGPVQKSISDLYINPEQLPTLQQWACVLLHSGLASQLCTEPVLRMLPSSCGQRGTLPSSHTRVHVLRPRDPAVQLCRQASCIPALHKHRQHLWAPAVHRHHLKASRCSCAHPLPSDSLEPPILHPSLDM